MIGTNEKHNLASYISHNVNLILNTYRCPFFQTATENLRCCSTASTMPCKTSQHTSVSKTRQRGNGKVLESAALVNHNGDKMVDVCVWNVNKLTEARTKMEVGKLRTKAEQ